MFINTKKVNISQLNFKNLIMAGFIATISLTPSAKAMQLFSKLASTSSVIKKSLGKFTNN